MKAMILAAGRGERLRPLTDTLPKPLIPFNGKPIIQYHLEKLAAAGFKEVIINISYLGYKVRETVDALDNGNTFGLNIIYSDEGDTVLETGGGIFNALPLLGDEPFITINADIFTDFDFSLNIDLCRGAPLWALVLANYADRCESHLGRPQGDAPTKIGASASSAELTPTILAHLILVPTPKNRQEGDFSLQNQGQIELLSNELPRSYIASGITLYHPDFFKHLEPGKYSVAPLWRQYADQGKISGSVFNGYWHDIGTLKTLQELEASLKLEIW